MEEVRLQLVKMARGRGLPWPWLKPWEGETAEEQERGLTWTQAWPPQMFVPLLECFMFKLTNVTCEGNFRRRGAK